MSYFEANGITAGYDKVPVVEKISFSVGRGELVGIVGANGSGKTTLLKSLCGILPHKGSCTLDGCRLEGLSARQISRLCSYIPQRSGISIDISALDVVLMGFNPQLGLLEHPGKEMEEGAHRALAQVGLADRADVNYQHLSEGQKQLCILARTLVASAKLLLLDEPESALDFRYRYQMLGLLRNWIKTNQSCAVVTLHDPMLALNYCDSLLLLSEGKTVGAVRPGMDDLAYTEQMLGQIYGSISLQQAVSKSGRRQLVLLKEDEL